MQKLDYLPEAHTDFIFAVIAEELGFVGVCAGDRPVRPARRARVAGSACAAWRCAGTFAGYCAFGIALWISLQSFVSIGVNLGMLPTKGLTLPLISSGGSSVLMTCAALGLLLRVSPTNSIAPSARWRAARRCACSRCAEATSPPTTQPAPELARGGNRARPRGRAACGRARIEPLGVQR